MSTILVVEDDPILSRGLQVLLQIEGYRVVLANTLKSAYSLLTEDVRLILLDLNLPDGNGFDFLKKTRASCATLPIIILTAKVEEEFAVHGLESGANDYIRKPFGNRELIARINNILKKAVHPGKQLQFGDVVLWVDQRRAEYLGEKLELNRREFDILCYFFERAEMLVSRDSILNNIDKECKISDRTIDSHISHLRSCLKKARIFKIKISSIYGLGYRLEKT